MSWSTERASPKTSVSCLGSTESRANRKTFLFVGPGAQMADEIFWDPEAGIGYAPSGAFGYGFMGACGTMLAVVLATI